MGSSFAAMLGSDIPGTALMRMLSVMAAGLVATVNSFAPSLFEMPRQAPIPVEPRLDRRIPAPNPSEYQAIREQRDWRNPYLSVTKGGFNLRSLSTPEPRFVVLQDLRRVLTELPVSDWPYGRVVVVQLPSIGLSLEMIQPDRKGAYEVLKALDADVWGWPP
jgi:hypothetical protein